MTSLQENQGTVLRKNVARPSEQESRVWLEVTLTEHDNYEGGVFYQVNTKGRNDSFSITRHNSYIEALVQFYLEQGVKR